MRPARRTWQLTYKLQNYQGFEAQAGKLDLTLPAGARQPATLIESLDAGHLRPGSGRRRQDAR